jgi:hypothetical protein
MARLVVVGAIVVVLLATASGAHAQSAAPSAAVPVPGTAALTAFLNGQPAPAAEQVVPLPSGGGYSLLVVPPADTQQPSWVTMRPAQNWFEQENFYSFGSSGGPRS